jgi:hypothetical protein
MLLLDMSSIEQITDHLFLPLFFDHALHIRTSLAADEPNVQDEPRPWLARLVLLGARDVTAMVVGSGALLGVFCELLPHGLGKLCRTLL